MDASTTSGQRRQRLPGQQLCSGDSRGSIASSSSSNASSSSSGSGSGRPYPTHMLRRDASQREHRVPAAGQPVCQRVSVGKRSSVALL